MAVTLPRRYKTLARARRPLIKFLVDGLKESGCRILHEPDGREAPFRIVFETAEGERIGIVAYAFFANNRRTRGRPLDEHRFQMKYGNDKGSKGLHRIWQDPYLLYTTLLLGIDPKRNIFVAADPVLHNPTRFFSSIEFKRSHVRQIKTRGWFSWERRRWNGVPNPHKKRNAVPAAASDPAFEVLLGGKRSRILDLVRFEREAWGESPGERQHLARHFKSSALVTFSPHFASAPRTTPKAHLHRLAAEFRLPVKTILELIDQRRRLKVAVRGAVAEEHLLRRLRRVEGVTRCELLTHDAGGDVRLRFRRRDVVVECKNASAEKTAQGLGKIDFQRSRRSKNPCSRYYSPTDFDIVAACTHAFTDRWDFVFAVSADLDRHPKCPDRLSPTAKLDDRWGDDARSLLIRVAQQK